MLEAQYKRDLNHNYLVFPRKEEQQDFRIQMLGHQKIEELLPCMMRRVNGEMLFTYEISGMQPLRQLFEKRAMNAQDLERFVKTLSQALEHLKEYLLDMEMLVLDPDYIFAEETTGNYFFCCFPDTEQSVFQSFHRLCEYFLNVLDHKDEEAVRLGYSLYRNTMEDNFSLLQMLREPVCREPVSSEPVPEEAVFTESVSSEQLSTESRSSQWDNRMPAFSEDQSSEPVKEDLKPSVRKMGFFKNKKDDLEKNKRENKERRKNRLQKNKSWEEYKGSPLPSYAGEKMFSYGESSCILQGVNRRQIFLLNTYPYLLGSLECGVDGYIEESKVSHFHARIDKKQEKYYITDLHSRYGTCINKEQIPPESSIEIKFGDVIELGNAAYVFLNKNNGK